MTTIPKISLSTLPPDQPHGEIVERKGTGHPDTICDALAEEFSRALCRAYLDRSGVVLHHNVDKALLRGGSARPRFGGGSVTEPIEIYLAGRATVDVGNVRLDIEEIAIETARTWLRRNVHGLDVDRHVRIHCLVRAGSQDLVDIFGRTGEARIPPANDTSFGVGFAPMTTLERLVLEVERRLNQLIFQGDRPAWGEDIKVMGHRIGEHTHLTIACALIDRHLTGPDDYLAQKVALVCEANAIADQLGFGSVSTVVNAADDPGSGSYFLTVTGTSAEAGDDGQVGRGNRANGLITPHRPMSLEALAGKNPVSHVGKLYNVTAREIAECIVAEIAAVDAAECFIVSEIGRPVTEPAFLEIRLRTVDGETAPALRRRVDEIAIDCLNRIPELADRFVNGEVGIY